MTYILSRVSDETEMHIDHLLIKSLWSPSNNQ